MMITARLARGPPRSAWASKMSPVAEAKAPESSATMSSPSAQASRRRSTSELTKLDLRSLVGVQLLAPGVHTEHIVDGQDVDVLDALGGELVVSLNVTGNLLQGKSSQIR